MVLDWSVIESEDPHWRTRPRKTGSRNGVTTYGGKPKGGNHSPERLRAAAFAVYHYHGWTASLIADQFSIPEATVHQWRKRYQWCSLSRWMKMEKTDPATLAPSGDLAEVAAVLHNARAGRIVGSTLAKQAKEGNLMGELADEAVAHERFKMAQAKRAREGLVADQEAREENDEVDDIITDLKVVDSLDKIQHRGGASAATGTSLNQQVVDYLDWEPS